MAHLIYFLFEIVYLSFERPKETKGGKAKRVPAGGFAFLEKAKAKIFYAKHAFCYTGQRNAFHR